ncbi:2,3-dimethylmalate lyase [Mycena kentingensis (nom. inval.)]|nr:2,3-dimethylmalate lyase [Mycena kentingensis (nom. inval.)]
MSPALLEFGTVASIPATKSEARHRDLKLEAQKELELKAAQDKAYYNARLDPKNYLDGPLSTNAATRLRQMLARPGIVTAPGICEGISARCALEAGFQCLVSIRGLFQFVGFFIFQLASQRRRHDRLPPWPARSRCRDHERLCWGKSSSGGHASNDIYTPVQAAEMVCSIDPQTPVIADADTGFGGPINIARTVRKYAQVGCAGLHIEDQIQTKRCGHLLGKQVVSREEFCMRIRAAVQARDAIPGNSDFVIIGRTDSAQVLGMEEALMRLKLASAAGADVLFIEGVKTKELLEKTVKALAPKPVLVNVISGGLTPSFTYREAEALGAKIIIFSLASCVPMVHAVRAAMKSLMETGTDFSAAQGMDPKAFFEVMGLKDAIALDAEAGGNAFKTI